MLNRPQQYCYKTNLYQVLTVYKNKLCEVQYNFLIYNISSFDLKYEPMVSDICITLHCTLLHILL